MENNTDNKPMRLHGDYFTVQEMASISGESTNTIKKRILRLGIKATVRDALYTSGDFENIKNVTMGRPKKATGNKPALDKKSPTKNKARKPKK